MVLTTKNVGDVIQDTGSFSQAYALIHMVFDDLKELERTLDFIHNTLVIRDSNGKNMVNRMLDMNKANIILK